jgi:hypothetical protein
MTDRLFELTRIDDRTEVSPVLVNVDNVAWIEQDMDGGTRIVFAVGLQHERANGPPLAIRVRESFEEISRLSRAARTTDREAIAEAWAEQSSRRQSDGYDR